MTVNLDLTGADWRTSSRSGGSGQCVQVALNLPKAPGYVAVRHSLDTDGPVIFYTDAEWTAFVGGVADGEFTK
jgi:hypothetical protein